MDNYGNDYGFMSQEGYASIDFTLLDRPNSNISSAPESTAALLPDLHVGDSSFASFDFLDGPSVDAFGGVLREADEAHSRDQGYRYDLQKNRKERSLLEQSSAGLHRGDGDPDSELPSTEYQIPFEAQKPISHVDFFSQGQTKESGHQEQQPSSDPGNDARDGSHDYFEQGQVSQQAQNAAGAGQWYNSWPGSNSQGDQTQVFLHTPSYDKNTAQLAGQMGYQSSQVPSTDAVPKATHSFLPTAKQSDSRQASSLPSALVNAAPSSVAKSSSRQHAYDYEGLMNGSSANQFRQNSSASTENAPSARRHQTSDANVGGQDALRGHAQSQAYKYAGQNLGTVAPVNEVSPLKVNDYDFLGGQYGMKGQTQSSIGQQQMAVDEMQTWHQHPLLSQSNQQHASYQQPYQDLSRHHQHSVDQQSQNARQQHVQQFLAANHQNQSLGNQLSAFLTESSLQDISRVPERQNAQLTVDNQRALLQQTNYAAMNNATNLNWAAGGSDASAMDGLAHDYLMGAQDQAFNWQALAAKASGQVDPAGAYGSLSVNRREAAGQPVAAYPGMQAGFQDYYGGSGKYSAANAQAEKPVARNGGSETSGGSIYGGSYQADVYDAAGNLHAAAQSSKHQALGKMPFWQNPYPQVEQNRSGNNLGQSNLPPRSPQVAAAALGRQPRTWAGLSGQQETIQGGIFTQNLANAEALKQSIVAGSSLQQTGHQAADLRQSSRAQSLEAAHYMQQSSSQAAASSQFLSALGTKAQSNWNRLNMQQSVPQTGVSAETPASLEANQKSNWNMQQASAETQSLANLSKQQNLWSGHNAQQRSRPAANSLHLFTDLDKRRNSMPSSHDLQQGSAQPSGSQVGKIDMNLQSSHNIQPSSVQGNEAPNTLLDLEASQQQSGWRDHLLLQGTSQTNNSLQAYNDLDKTSSWRNIWQTPATGEASSQLLEIDDGRQQNTLWGHNLQKSRSEAVEPHVASINPREQSAWSSQDIQQDSPQTDQLLSGLEAEQQGSHHSHTLDDRHQGGQYAHLLHDERAHSKTTAEVDARRNTAQGVYSLQSQVAAAEQNVRHMAIQNAYNLQSQVGMTETDARHKANQDVYSLQTQIRAGEGENRPQSNLSPYNLQAQLASAEETRQKASQNLKAKLASAEAEARRKASENTYNLQTQVAMGETDVRHKAGQSSMYSLQSQVGIGEADARHKANHSAYSTQSHLGVGEKDSRYRGAQNVFNLQSQVGSLEADAQHKGRQNSYNVQSQVAVTAEAEARLQAQHKASQNAYSLQAQVGGYSQPTSMDGRQGRSQWPLGSQQSSSQSQTSMFVFPSSTGKNQSSQNSANLQAWNASVSNVDSWQKSATSGSGPYQQADHLQMENVDSRQQKAQSGSNSRHSSPQNENHLQSLSGSRPPSRLGRPNSSLDASLSGAIGAAPAKPASLNHWQNHSSNMSATNASQNDALPTWPQGHASPARGDVEKFNSAGQSTSGTDDVLPQWSRGQTLSSQEGLDQVNLVGESNEVRPMWSRGQSQVTRKEVEHPLLGGESRVRTSEAQQTWARGQNMLPQNNVEESSSGLNEATPTWSRQQSIAARKGVEQLNLGELNADMNEEDLPAWSRGQSAYNRKEVEELDSGVESINRAEEVPIWSRGQSKVDQSARNVMDQLDLGEESNSGRGEVLPTWSRGQSTPTRKDTEQSGYAGEANRGSDLVPSWSRGQSAPAGRDTEELNVEAESNMGKLDALPAWSQGQHALSRKEADQLNQAADSSSGGTNRSVKIPLSARPEAEKRVQAEMSFLDRGTQRESNSAASPAPSPDSNPFSTATKQKPSTKTSSLSRNTLELLNRPEEPNESSSMNDEEEFQEEELDLEDSGVNASGISLAHLRRPGQPSGPLSPQGFGLRLAPPSHLSQNAQGGKVGSASSLGVDASRTIPTLTGKEMPQSNSISGNDPALNDQIDTQMDIPVSNEVSTPSPVPATSTATSVVAGPQQDPHPRFHEHEPAEVVERTSLPSGELDGSTSQSATPWSNVNPGVQQGVLGEQQSVETGQGPANTFPAQSMDPMLEDGNVTSKSYNISQADVMGHLTSNHPQKAPQHASTTQQVLQSGGMQTAALSKLLNTFKDSLSGQTKQTSAQPQQAGNAPERGNSGGYPQVGNKQMNGLQPGQWPMDPSQMASSVKAELFKRLAAQVQRPNQGSFGHLQPNSNSTEQALTGGESFLGKAAAAGHYFSGQAFGQGQVFPGQQNMASGQSQPGQPAIQGLPGQDSTTPSPRQMYNHSYNQSVQGMTMDESHQGYLQSQSHTLLPGQQVMLADQRHMLQSQNSSGQVSTPGQSYPGQTYNAGQGLPGKFNGTGRSYSGQTFNQSQGQQPMGGTPGKTFPQSHDFSGQPGTPGQTLSGPETPVQPGSGQVSSPTVAGKQTKGRQPRKLPQKAAGKEVNKSQMQGRAVKQQSAGYPAQQGLRYQSQQVLPGQSVAHDHQYGSMAEQNDLSSSGKASQEDIPSDAQQPTSLVPTEGLGSKDLRTGDNREMGAAEKPGTIPARMEGSDNMHGPPRSSHELNQARQDSQKASLLQQWQNVQSNSQGGISDYQFQKILEARPSLAAALEPYKGNPRVYQAYAAQLRASLGQQAQQAQMARQLGHFQQQARDQSAVSASTGSVQASSDGSAAAQAIQASHALQVAQAVHAQAAHEAQSMHAAQAVQAAHNAQVAQVHAAVQAAEVYQAAQAAQAAQAVQAAQAAQAAQVIHAAQVAQAAQAAQAGQGVDQAAIISKNANTAQRLQYLTQMAQRGQTVNGMAAPWFSGMTGRPGSGPLLPNRMGEGTGQETAAASAPLGGVMDRSGNDDLAGSRFLNSYRPAPPQPKKRKEPSPLPPWREVISQAGGYVSSMSGSELEWATATNHIPEVEPRDEVVDVSDTRAVIISRAKRRLRLTTQLMQQITPAVPARFMQSKALEDRQSATYTLSKLAFADACRISSIARRIREVAAARDAEESRIEKERELAMKEAEKTGENLGRPMPLPANITDRFKLRTKLLENDLQRLENSPSAVELVKDMQDNERIGLVNRLVVHHSLVYTPHNLDSPVRAVPQKYVTTVQMPTKLPEGLLCVKL